MMVSGASDEAIVNKISVKTRKVIQYIIKFCSRMEIVKIILRDFDSKFGNNKLKNDLHQIICKLRWQNNRLSTKFHSQEK